ncbi:MAG: UDP-2,3-diacylglucosamine diphosphatase LpxI [Halanaerobiales bacterium]|nr:UDP-2,3-diacylglucosamine diphosphatase LpxI [Halanaerobiales bacterium]
MDKIGLIAGYGKLPLIWAKKAQKHDIDVHAFPISEECSTDLNKHTSTTDNLSLTQLDSLINKLKEYEIKQIILLGKVNKKFFYEMNNFDQRFIKLFKNTDNLEDHTILKKLVEEFDKEGIEVLQQNIFLDDLLVPSGLLNDVKPSDRLLEDMKYAFQKAKQVANSDIGQTVLIKDKAVLAVEALEGTDQAIKRTGNLVNEGAVMAKVSKQNHDFRFDIPTIGLDTVKNLISIKADGLVLESDKILLIDRERVIKLANEANLSIMAISLEEV